MTTAIRSKAKSEFVPREDVIGTSASTRHGGNDKPRRGKDMLHVQMKASKVLDGNELDVYVEIIDALSTSEFSATVLKAAAKLAGVDEILAFKVGRNSAQPIVLMCKGAFAGFKERADAYRDQFFRCDPMSKLLLSNDVSDPIIGVRVLCDDIQDDRFRRDCFVKPCYDERISIVKSSATGSIVLSFFRTSNKGAFRDEEVERLSSFGRIVASLIAARAREPNSISSAPSIGELEFKLAALHPKLTNRERAVCARTVIGMTAEGTAIDLGIKTTSVLTYRRRAYERLKVSTALQLAMQLFH
jgi:DNA-binding CsgD family transcriptional regulator